MNTDRFLTRVFDKQERKMIYVGDFFHSEDGTKLMFLGISLALLEPVLMGTDDEGYVTDICIGDRFIPMQCTGSPDKNKKLIYAGDILRMPSKDDWDKINFASYEVFFCDNDSCDSHIGFRMNRVHYHGSVSGGWVPNFNPKTTSRMEIIGNRWENPKLLEESK